MKLCVGYGYVENKHLLVLTKPKNRPVSAHSCKLTYHHAWDGDNCTSYLNTGD